MAAGGGERGHARFHRGPAYFAVVCGFSHRNQDDPIVFPGQPGRSHDHTFFANRSTDAFEPVEPFPAGLKVIAGDAAAQSAQSERVTFWSCGRARSSTVPTCLGGRRSSLRLHVNFPNCWDGSRLDSADHKSHLAYSSDGACPASHPVEVPALSLVVYYGIAGGPDAELSSGGQFSGHADFVNAWNQEKLARLVDRYLNRRR